MTRRLFWTAFIMLFPVSLLVGIELMDPQTYRRGENPLTPYVDSVVRALADLVRGLMDP